MNQSLNRLLEGMRRALRDDVLPEVASAHARGQMAGVIDILDKLERMVVWSPDVLREQSAILAKYGRAIDETLRSGGVEPPRGDVDLSASLEAGQLGLEAHVAAGKARLVEVVDWLFDQGTLAPVETRQKVDVLVQAAMREAMAPERRLVRRADFSGMAGASD